MSKTSGSPQLSFFFLRRSFVEPSAHAAARMRWSGQIFWLLASGPNASDAPSSRLHRPACSRTIGSWEVVSSYSSATAPECSRDFSRRSTSQTRKELAPEVAACARSLNHYLWQPRCAVSRHAVAIFIEPPRHRWRRFHRLQSDPRLAGEIPAGPPDRDR